MTSDAAEQGWQRGSGWAFSMLRRERLLLSAVFVIALAVRVVAASRKAVIFNDGPIFLSLAEALRDGHFAEALGHAYHPLYPVSIWIASLVSGASLESAAIAVAILFGALAVVALHAFLRAAFGQPVAIVGALVLALHPYAIRFSADVQSDSLYLALFLASVGLLFRALRSSSVPLALCTGVLAGLAYLARPEGAGVLLIASTLVAVGWLRGSWAGGSALRWLGGLLVGAAIPAIPYLMTLRVLAGSWQISQKKSVLGLLGVESSELALSTAADAGVAGLVAVLGISVIAALVLYVSWQRLETVRGSEATRVRLGAPALAGMVVLGAVAATLTEPASMLTFAAAMVSTLRPELLLLLVIGIASRARQGPQGRSLFISLFLILYSIVLFGLLLHYGYLSRRHALPPLSLLFGYVAIGVLATSAALGTWMGRLRGGAESRAREICLALVLVVIACIALPKAWSDHRAEELAGRQAAEWLSEHPSSPGRLAANRSKLGYYAEREWRPLRVAGVVRALSELRDDGVRYVVVEDNAIGADGVLLGPLREHGGLRLQERHRVEANGRVALIYEIETSATR